MKKLIFFVAIALTAMCSGCSEQNDVLELPDTQLLPGHAIRISASMTGQTRLGIEDTGKQLVYAWEDVDSLRVYSASNPKGTTFHIEASSDRVLSNMASFVGTPEFAFQEGEPLYAVFDGSGNYSLDEEGNLQVHLEGQTGCLDKRYQYLFGEAVYHEGEAVDFALRHVVTMMKLRIALPEGVTSVQQICLGASSTVPLSSRLVLSQSPSDFQGTFSRGSLVYTDTDQQTSGLTLQGDFQPDADGWLTLYCYLSPAKRYYSGENKYLDCWFEPNLYLADADRHSYVSAQAVAEKAIEAGKTYQVTTSLYPLVDFDNETEADAGTAAKPYRLSTVDQLYSWMYRCNFNLSNEQGTPYNGCCYQLANDVVFQDERPWSGVQYGKATFDGNGFALKGCITFGANDAPAIFSSLSSSTIANLTLSFDQVTTAENWGNFGLLAMSVYSSTLIGCANHTDLNYRVGSLQMSGLVANARYSRIYFCSNTGNLTCSSYVRRMGGVVGESYRTEVIGCYNTGKLTVGNPSSRTINIGGVAGYMYGQSTLVNCWSRTAVTIDNMVYDDQLSADGNPINVGGLVGWLDGTLKDSFWQEGIGEAAASGNVLGCATFPGEIPSAEQIATLNRGVIPLGWKFTDQATLEPVTDTSLPDMPKEDW